MIAILSIIGCGILIFMGVFCQTVVIQFDASFYWWGIAGYVSAVIFVILFITEILRIFRPRGKRHGKVFKTDKVKKEIKSYGKKASYNNKKWHKAGTQNRGLRGNKSRG